LVVSSANQEEVVEVGRWRKGGAETAQERRNSAAPTTSATVVHGARSVHVLCLLAIFDFVLGFLVYVLFIFLEFNPDLHLIHGLLYETVLNHGTAL
jgi:hypothetical protein